MLTSWSDTLLNILTQLTGAGGAMAPVLDNGALKATFYLFLFLFLRVRFKTYGHQQERLLMWGFWFGFLTQLFGLGIHLSNNLGWTNPTTHAFSLSLSHTLHSVALITIAAGYTQSCLFDEKRWIGFLKIGLAATLLISLFINWQWLNQSATYPAKDFNQINFSWLFHINTSIWLSLAIFIIAIKKNTKAASLIMIALSLFFTNEVLQALALISPSHQHSVFIPLSGLSYFFALAILTYDYLKNSVEERLSHTTALAKSEAKLNAMLKTINDPIWLKDPTGVFLACNAASERVYGAKEADIIGKTDYDFVDKATADSFRENDLLAIKKGAASINEEWMTFADNGQRILVETTKTPMFDQTGNLLGVLGIAHDITNRKAMETQAKQYELIVNSASEAIISKTINGVVTSWNAGAEKMFGYTAEEMIGKSTLALFPKGLQRENNYIQAKILNGDHIPAFDTIRLHQSGRTIHISTSMSPILDEKGTVAGISEIASDNTEHITADQNFKRLSGLYKALSEINQAIVRMEHEAELFPLVCRCAVDYGGLSMAWVGVLDPKDNRINPVAMYGEHLEYLDGIYISANASIKEGQGPGGKSNGGHC